MLRERPEVPARRAPTELLAAFGCAALLCALIVYVHRASPRTLVSAHGFLHAAIAQRFQTGQGAGAPPENPFFAGEPLPYYWFFQCLGGTLAALLRIDALHALELWVLAAAAGLVLSAAALGRRALGSTAAGLVAAWLVLAGSFPQGPLVLAYRWLSWGPPHDDGKYLWGVVHPVTRAMRAWDTWAMFGPLVNFFFNVTARPLGIAATVVLLLALHRFLERGSAPRGLVLAAASAACASFSSIVGLSTAGALGAALLAVALAPRLARGPRPPAAGAVTPRAALAAALWLAAGLALAAPTFRHLLGTVPLAFHRGRELLVQLGRIGESAWLLVLLALYGARRLPAEQRGFAAALLAAAGLLLVAAALVALPVDNEDNIFHAALVLLAVPAAGSVLVPAGALAAPIDGARVARRRAALVCLVFLPPFAVVVAAYLGRPPIAVAFAQGRILRTPAESPEARLYEWIAVHAEHDAVLVVDPTGPVRAVGGNTVELPALTGRTILTERLEHYLVKPHADAQLRHWIARDAVRGERLGPEADRYLASLGRPVYVVACDADPDLARRLAELYGEASFRAGGIAVHRWRKG